MILLIDNYDSFSYNLFQLVGEIDPDIKVVRNDELTADEVFALNPSHIIISPGPGRPCDAGVCEDVIRANAARENPVPLLGVCLGHQAICETFGAVVSYAKRLMHGKQSIAKLDTSSSLFKGLPEQCGVARYHSLAADESTMPDCLKITAKTADDEIMAAEHKTAPIFGVQFHPESILTENGRAMLKNFLEIKR